MIAPLALDKSRLSSKKYNTKESVLQTCMAYSLELCQNSFDSMMIFNVDGVFWRAIYCLRLWMTGYRRTAWRDSFLMLLIPWISESFIVFIEQVVREIGNGGGRR
jgi:hypothetical protein